MSASAWVPLVVSWLAVGIPLCFALAVPWVAPVAPFRRAQHAAALALGLALVVAAARAVLPAAPEPHVVRLDLVTCVMLLLVTFIALVIVRYSQSYLQGDAGQDRFARALLLTLAAVSTLVLARHLLVIAIAWMGTSIALHQLLTFYRDRRPALVVAHKKFLVSRLADVCVFGALALIFQAVGSLDLDRVDAWSAAHPTPPTSVQCAAVLLVLGVALKSAQLPFHGWLLQVMEAPTPVSALLHAGVVNIGGFFLIRLAPFLEHAFFARTLLVIIGTSTAVVASLVTTTRVSVKVALAWSTCAQMGFMLVECGFAAWHLALLHLVAHSLYKAHAFLDSGGAVDAWRAQVFAPQSRKVTWLGLLGKNPRSFQAVMISGLTLGILFCGWHLLAGRLLPTPAAATPFGLPIVSLGLMVLVATQSFLRLRPGSPLAREIHARLFAGLYLDEIFTRLTFRIWPPRLQPVVSKRVVHFPPIVESASRP